MSGRCKACNKKFTESEMLAKNSITKEPEDLCGKCRRIVGVGKDDGLELREEVEDLTVSKTPLCDAPQYIYPDNKPLNFNVL